jgi:hypothetical protein
MEEEILDYNDDKRIPEAALWLAVLNTFIDDIVKLHLSQRNADELMRAAQDPWGELLCEMAGIDHDYFVDRMTSLHRKTSKERASGIFIN